MFHKWVHILTFNVAKMKRGFMECARCPRDCLSALFSQFPSGQAANFEIESANQESIALLEGETLSGHLCLLDGDFLRFFKIKTLAYFALSS